MIWTDGFTSIDKNRIYFQGWSPDQNLIAQVHLVHGLGEHSGRYKHVSKYFTRSDISLTAMDLLGHGRSEFPLPLLIMVGGADQFTLPQAVIDFGNYADHHQTTLKILIGGYHELHNEIFKEDVLAEITGWIKKINPIGL